MSYNLNNRNYLEIKHSIKKLLPFDETYFVANKEIRFFEDKDNYETLVNRLTLNIYKNNKT